MNQTVNNIVIEVFFPSRGEKETPLGFYPSNTNLCYSFVGFWMACSFKRWVSNQTLIAEDPDAPQVHLLTVSVTLYHLWREVVQCAAHCPTSDLKKKKSGQRQKETISINQIMALSCVTSAAGVLTFSRFWTWNLLRSCARNLLKFVWKYETMGAVWFLTSKKAHGQTNQSLQFSAPHDSQGADSLAWYPGESPSSRGNKSAHQISPPWTYG